MSFSLEVSHRKVFNEAISIQGYMSYLLFFSTGVFLEEDMQDILKMCIASKFVRNFCFEQWSYMLCRFLLIFPLDFEGVLMAYTYI